MDIGAEIKIQKESGTLIASSSMGITIFDLFTEVLNEEDMRRFLKMNNIKGKFLTLAN